MKKIIFLIFLVFHFWFLNCRYIYASDYVLPYPSFMPGHRLYRIHQAWEKIQEYWHFGNLAKFKYHLQLSDKYLVEAKTLFEYEQYLLATKSLQKSTQHWQETYSFLQKARNEGKDLSQKEAILLNAAEKHREVLKKLLTQLPDEIFWQEEKKEGEVLEINKLIEEAITEISN